MFISSIIVIQSGARPAEAKLLNTPAEKFPGFEKEQKEKGFLVIATPSWT